MDPMRDLVRDRTADLNRVAEGLRRERVLRTPAPEVPAARTAASTSMDGPCVPSRARQAA